MASMLETLAIVFDMNADDALKELKKLIEGVNETEERLDDAEKATNKFRGSLLGAFTTLAGGVTALFTVGAALSSFNAAIDYADKIGETAEAIGVSTENLSAWSDAAAISGGSADGLQSSVRNLSKDLYQFAETGKSRAEPFLKSFGIAMKDVNGKARDVFEVLPDIAEAMEGMSKQEAIGFGQKIGLDDGTIMLLQQGKAGLEEVIKRQKELGVVTKEDSENAAKFKDALEDTGKALRPIFLGIANFILPAFTWMIEKIQKATGYVKEHGVFFKVAVMGMATAITMYLLPALIKSAAAMWANPLTWIIAGILLLIGLIALIAEDIYMFATGGQSLIGQLAKKWKWFGDTVEFLGKLFKALFKDVKTVIDFFTNMWDNPQQALEDFKFVLKNLWNDFINSVPGLSKVLDTVVAVFNAAIGGIKATIEAVSNTINTLTQKPIISSKGVWTTLKDIATGTNTDADEAGAIAMASTPIVAAKKLRQVEAQTSDVQRLGASNISNSNSVKNDGNYTDNSQKTINITTGADPQEVKKVVKEELNSQTKTAVQQFDDGVSH